MEIKFVENTRKENVRDPLFQRSTIYIDLEVKRTRKNSKYFYLLDLKSKKKKKFNPNEPLLRRYIDLKVKKFAENSKEFQIFFFARFKI